MRGSRVNLIAIRSDRASANSDDCSLCNSPHPQSEAHAPVQHRTDLIPWAVVLTAAVVIAGMGAGTERWFGVGATAGLLAGVACAWVTWRATRRGRGIAHVRELQSLAEDSEMRVQGLIKQFEWAVNDVVRVKRDSERAQAAADALMERARERDRYVKKLEKQLFDLRDELRFASPAAERTPAEAQFEGPHPLHVPFRWALHIDGTKVTIELETGVTIHRPSRVRILDRDGQVVAVSGVPVLLAEGGFGFTIDGPPLDLVTNLDAGGELGYVVEALVQYEWKPTHLEDSGRRTRAVIDSKGHLFRAPDAPGAAQAFAAKPDRSDLN